MEAKSEVLGVSLDKVNDVVINDDIDLKRLYINLGYDPLNPKGSKYILIPRNNEKDQIKLRLDIWSFKMHDIYGQSKGKAKFGEV